ncbi:ABC transporter permease [Anaerocolumna xylanovorans]|uniref:Putative aldouronate transport system permease protein n=1 Tax=Anaerocolumna xylanovorans DSM 12503 TaxID=1121345 RepID=A0A1M7YKU2_9FIRM|nr:ABC transporter permease subunit [Anaerocolumna xylanovorans]SHO53241.1 putative aldouronate transport system permease protein [Anaerocolumna xylanovorans DSM 12503]
MKKRQRIQFLSVKQVLKCWQLYVLLIPALLWALIFAYYPMYGLVIAFKDYKIRAGIMASPWADPLLKYFKQFFSTSIAVHAIWNTVIISLESLVIAFPIPIIFALLLNQIQKKGIQKTIQTISYAPYFMSNVVVVSIITVMFSANGVINNIRLGSGGKGILFTSLPEWFRTLFIGSNIWQTMGFNAVIFIAALTAISPDYYEAATIDGASRFQRILYIDIPLIMPTIILMLILQIGNIMNIGYEKAYLMQNGSNTIVSELISTYVYKVGLQTAQYSFATAVGLFNSVVNFIILVAANRIARKASDISIF